MRQRAAFDPVRAQRSRRKDGGAPRAASDRAVAVVRDRPIARSPVCPLPDPLVCRLGSRNGRPSVDPDVEVSLSPGVLDKDADLDTAATMPDRE